jgi:hypothetical protein
VGLGVRTIRKSGRKSFFAYNGGGFEGGFGVFEGINGIKHTHKKIIQKFKKKKKVKKKS